MHYYSKSHNAPNALTNQNGFVALFVVVIISAVTFMLAYNASFLSLGELELGFTDQKGAEAFAIAEGCVEETLGRIRTDANFGLSAGVITIPVGNGTCNVSVTDLGGNQRSISSIATLSNYHKRVLVTISVNNGQITILSWQEQ